MCLYLLNVSIKKKIVRGAEARHTHTRTHSQTASWHRDNVWSGSVFMCEENRPFLTISPSPLHKPPSSRGHVSFVQRTKRGSPALFVLAFMEWYISASQPRWRKYADRKESADRYATKARGTVGQIHVWGRKFTIYNSYGFTTPLWQHHTHPQASRYISPGLSHGECLAVRSSCL